MHIYIFFWQTHLQETQYFRYTNWMGSGRGRKEGDKACAAQIPELQERPPKNTLESQWLSLWSQGSGWYAAFCSWVRHRNSKCSNCWIPFWLSCSTSLLPQPSGGLRNISTGRRGWRRGSRGWGRGPASAEREGWLQPGRARPTAGEAETAQRTRPPPPPGARTGRPGPEASSYPSGMQVLPRRGRKPGVGWGESFEWWQHWYIFVSKSQHSEVKI